MSTKHVKLYESFRTEEDNLIKIFENVLDDCLQQGIALEFIGSRLYEQAEETDQFTEWLYTDEPLNPAERRAQDQGKQILNKRQMAVMYLAALGLNEYGDITEYMKVIPGMETYDLDNMSNSNIIAVLSEVFDIDKDRTFNLTLTKFKNHMTGEVEDPEVLAKHADYEKLRNIYNILDRKATQDGPNDIALALAKAVGDTEGLQDRMDAMDTRREEMNLRSSERRATRKKEDMQIGQFIHSAVKAYRGAGIPADKYSRVIFSQLGTKFPQIDKDRAFDAYVEYLRQMKEDFKFYPLMRPSL